MKWIAKFFGLLFILAGIAAAGFAIETTKDNLDSIPVLLAPVEEAENCARELMDAVAAGDEHAIDELCQAIDKFMK
jgi:hypothetical protein